MHKNQKLYDVEVCSKVEECQRNFSLSIAKVHCKPSLQNHYAAADIQTPNHPLKIHVLSLTLCCFILKYAFLTMQSENNKFKHILILWPWIMKAVTFHQIIHSIITERCHLILNAITFLSLIFLKQDWKGFWPKMPHSQRFPCGVRLKSRILTSKAQRSLKINQIVNARKRCKMNVECLF